MAAHRIIFANEKGGSGKSTSAVHTAIALAVKGHKVTALDLDTRQRTFGRYRQSNRLYDEGGDRAADADLRHVRSGRRVHDP